MNKAKNNKAHAKVYSDYSQDKIKELSPHNKVYNSELNKDLPNYNNILSKVDNY